VSKYCKTETQELIENYLTEAYDASNANKAILAIQYLVEAVEVLNKVVGELNITSGKLRESFRNLKVEYESTKQNKL